MQAEDHDGVAICNRTGPETKEHFLLRGHCNLNTCIWSGAVLKASRPCAMHMGDKADTQWPDGAGWRWVATLGADTCMHVSKKEERWRLLFCFCGVFICIDLRLEKATRRFFFGTFTYRWLWAWRTAPRTTAHPSSPPLLYSHLRERG